MFTKENDNNSQPTNDFVWYLNITRQSYSSTLKFFIIFCLETIKMSTVKPLHVGTPPQWVVSGSPDHILLKLNLSHRSTTLFGAVGTMYT